MTNQTKTCTKCRIKKKFTEFYKDNTKKDKLSCKCISCFTLYRNKNKKRLTEYSKLYGKSHKDVINKRSKIYYYEHKEERAEYKKRWYLEHKEEKDNYDILYRANNKEKRRKLKRDYHKHKCSIDPIYKTECALRSRIRKAIKSQSGTKAYKSMELLGCTMKECRTHIESLFTEGMSWDNHGIHGWHLDHIKPCASFDLKDPEQQKECFHYTNLQPLWAIDNLKKGDTYND
jgi:uncharacterized protein (DUF1810 family)